MSQGKLNGSAGAGGGGSQNDLMSFLFGDMFSGTHHTANTYNQPTNNPIYNNPTNTTTNLGNQVIGSLLGSPTTNMYQTHPASSPSTYTPQQQAIYQQHPQWAPNYGVSSDQALAQQVMRQQNISPTTYRPMSAPVAHTTTGGGTSVPGSGAFANRVGGSAGSAVGKGLFGGQGGQGQTPAGQTPSDQTPSGPGMGGVAYDEEGNLMPGYQLDENNNPVWTGQSEPTAPVAPTTPAMPIAYDDNGNLLPGYQLDENNNPVWTGQVDTSNLSPISPDTSFQMPTFDYSSLDTNYGFDPSQIDTSSFDFSSGW
jgi:hypothetical protein